jgi:hypothetical protein
MHQAFFDLMIRHFGSASFLFLLLLLVLPHVLGRGGLNHLHGSTGRTLFLAIPNIPPLLKSVAYRGGFPCSHCLSSLTVSNAWDTPPIQTAMDGLHKHLRRCISKDPSLERLCYQAMICSTLTGAWTRAGSLR